MGKQLLDNFAAISLGNSGASKADVRTNYTIPVAFPLVREPCWKDDWGYNDWCGAFVICRALRAGHF